MPSSDRKVSKASLTAQEQGQILNQGIGTTGFKTIFDDPCACAFCLLFSVFVWTVVLVFAYFSVCVDSCACACFSQCLYELVCFRLHFPINSCACAYSCVVSENHGRLQ